MKYAVTTKFDCFSNENRVKLFLCLEEKKCVSELLTLCTLSQSALSQHLKILKDAGFIDCVRDGKKQIYMVTNKEALAIAKKIIAL